MVLLFAGDGGQRVLCTCKWVTWMFLVPLSGILCPLAHFGVRRARGANGQRQSADAGDVAASPKEQSTWSSTKSAPIDLAPLKNPPEGAPIAEGQLVTHKPRTMSEAVDRRKLLVGVDPEGKPSYVPGWAVKHAAARARGISSGVVGTG